MDGDNSEIVEPTSKDQPWYGNMKSSQKVIWGLVIVMVIVILFCTVAKPEGFLQHHPRDDIQSDWSVDSAIRDLMSKQENILRRNLATQTDYLMD